MPPPDQPGPRDHPRPQSQPRPRDALGRPLPIGSPEGVEPVSEQALPPEQALREAQRLLDHGRAFSAHEVLEASWKAAPAGERDLWQGLAQLCVGITHLQRGNRVGGVRLLRRAAGRLATSPPAYDVPVTALATWAVQHAHLVEDDPDATVPPPRLSCTPGC